MLFSYFCLGGFSFYKLFVIIQNKYTVIFVDSEQPLIRANALQGPLVAPYRVVSLLISSLPATYNLDIRNRYLERFAYGAFELKAFS